MRVLLADHHLPVRWALRTAIREEPGMVVVGEVGAAGELLARVQLLDPDVILLEWELPGLAAADALAALHGLAAHPWVVVLSQQPEAEGSALAAGADAFVSKVSGPERLLCALRRLEGPQSSCTQDVPHPGEWKAEVPGCGQEHRVDKIQDQEKESY